MSWNWIAPSRRSVGVKVKSPNKDQAERNMENKKQQGPGPQTETFSLSAAA